MKSESGFSFAIASQPLGEIDGVKFLAWKSDGVKFLTNFMSGDSSGAFTARHTKKWKNENEFMKGEK